MTPDSIAEVLQHPVARAVAWSLVHFVWQGTLIGCAAALALSLLRAAGSEARYLVACAALVLMALAPPITTWVVLDRPPSTAVSPVAAVVPGPAAPHAAADSAAITSPASASNQTATLQGILASWLPSILGAWFVGVLLLSVRLTAGWALLQRRLSRECLSAGEAWDARLADLAARLGLTRAVRLRVSSSLAVPCAVGWWRPLVLLPTSALAGLTPEQMEAILAHELSHIRRCDYLVNLAQSLVETLLFYHPGVWWVSNRIRIEREYCCDDQAVRLCRSRLEYARALSGLEECRRPGFLLAAGAPSLVSRIRRVLGGPGASRGPQWEVAIVAGVLVLGFALGARAIGQPQAGRQVAEVAQRMVPPPTPPAPSPVPPPSSPEPPLPPAPPVWPSMPADIDAPAPGQAPPAPPEPPEPMAAGLAAPPAPQSPPAPPAPPAPPSEPEGSWFERLAGRLFGGGNGQSTTTMQWNEDGKGVKLQSRGTVTFTDDETDVKTVTAGGYFLLTLRDGATNTYEVRAKSDGSLDRLWNGKPLGPEGRAWLARTLPEFLKQSGINADARVTRILARKGPSGVLDDISTVKSAYVKRITFELLFDKAKLDATLLSRAIRHAGVEIDSDYERATLLTTVAKRGLPDEGSRLAFAEATRSIKSDYEKHRALDALLAAGTINSQIAAVIVDAARSMRSDYELAGLLIQLNRTQALNQASVDLAFTLADGIKSDYERHRALSALLANRTLDDAMRTRLLQSAARMSSDYELAGLLIELIHGRSLDGPPLDAFFSAVAAMRNDYERGRVLAAALGTPGPTGDLRVRVIHATMKMGNEYERANLLVASTKGTTFDPATRKAYLDAASSLKSEYERNRALAAIARM